MPEGIRCPFYLHRAHMKRKKSSTQIPNSIRFNIKKVLDDVEENFKRRNEEKEKKIELICKYLSPPFAVEFLLFWKLSNEKIIEIGEKYRKKRDSKDYELRDELLSICGYKNSSNRKGILIVNEFTLDDLYWLQQFLNGYWRKRLHEWMEHDIDAVFQLGKIVDTMRMENFKKGEIIKELNEVIKKTNRTIYDRDILEAALSRYKYAPRLEKNYERSLLAELKSAGIAKEGFEDTNEWTGWNDAFKQYSRSKNKVKPNSPRR